MPSLSRYLPILSLHSIPIGGMHIARGFELVPVYEDMLHSTNDGFVVHWAQGWYHPHAHSHK